jgi:UDP:flavonoid glycosyltransferase YjiC (YdhE family)
MKIVFLTYGTDGDTRPLLALAQAVIARGHEAHVLADVAGEARARALGIPFTALAGDMRAAFAPGGAFGALLRDGADMARLTRACAAQARDHTRPWLEAACAAAQGSDVLVYSGLAGFVGLAAADGLDIPCIGAAMWPMTPTRAFAPPFLGGRRLPGWLNLLAHRAFERMTWSMFGPALNRVRAQVFGAPPRRRPWRGNPVLYGCSPTLLARPGDWPAGAEITGAWQLPADPDWQPLQALLDFLADGPPPVYVGFGSMAGIDAATLAAAIGTVAQGRRVLFQPGWSGIDTARLPPGVFVLDDMPHDWLFPRMALVVHHGGAGTTHAAARAGVPSVVVPFAGDQFFWAQRLAALGIALTCPAARLDGTRLAHAVEAASAHAMRERAAETGRRIRTEDGVRTAVDRLLGGTAQKTHVDITN